MAAKGKCKGILIENTAQTDVSYDNDLKQLIELASVIEG